MIARRFPEARLLLHANQRWQVDLAWGPRLLHSDLRHRRDVCVWWHHTRVAHAGVARARHAERVKELLVIRRNHKAGEISLGPLQPDPRELMRPFPAGLMRMWPISTRVNKPENDDPSIIEPIELASDAA